MITKDSYYYSFEDGTSVWLAVGAQLPDSFSAKDIKSKETRVMLIPENGKVLQHKETKEINDGIWLKDSKESDYVEIDRPEEKEIKKEVGE